VSIAEKYRTENYREPWEPSDREVVDATGDTVCEIFPPGMTLRQRRMVACVNACEGIPTAALYLIQPVFKKISIASLQEILENAELERGDG